MKNLTTRMMIAAAVLAVAAVSASAQTYKAEIPLTFRAAGVQMLPGSYKVTIMRHESGIPYVQVINIDSKKSAFLMSYPGQDAPKAWVNAGHPMLAFECVAESCSLKQLWNGTDSATYRFATPKPAHGEAHAELVVVKLASTD
jgi:hypothetical protein